MSDLPTPAQGKMYIPHATGGPRGWRSEEEDRRRVKKEMREKRKEGGEGKMREKRE